MSRGNGLKKNDFDLVKTIMRDIPIGDKEAQTDYFVRLKETHPDIPSRSTLNMIFRAQNYEEFCKIRSGYNGKKARAIPVKTEPEAESEEDIEAVKIRVSFELGETAKKAIDGLLALAGVKL